MKRVSSDQAPWVADRLGNLSGSLSGSFGVRLTARDIKREMSSSISLTRSASEDSLAGTRWVEVQTWSFLRRVS